MQCLSLNGLHTLLTEGMFMPPQSEGPPKLSRMTAILLVFQADSWHEEITNIYMGLVVHRVKSHLYTPNHILNFVKDIEINLQVANNALKARGDPGKRHTYCLFVDNLNCAMSIPTDPPMLPGVSHQLHQRHQTGSFQHLQQSCGDVLASLCMPHHLIEQ